MGKFDWEVSYENQTQDNNEKEKFFKDFEQQLRSPYGYTGFPRYSRELRSFKNPNPRIPKPVI